LALWNITVAVYPTEESTQNEMPALFNLNGNGAATNGSVEILQFEVKTIGAVTFEKESVINVDGFSSVKIENLNVKGQIFQVESAFKIARVQKASKAKIAPVSFSKIKSGYPQQVL